MGVPVGNAVELAEETVSVLSREMLKYFIAGRIFFWSSKAEF